MHEMQYFIASSVIRAHIVCLLNVLFVACGFGLCSLPLCQVQGVLTLMRPNETRRVRACLFDTACVADGAAQTRGIFRHA